MSSGSVTFFVVLKMFDFFSSAAMLMNCVGSAMVGVYLYISAFRSGTAFKTLIICVYIYI